MTSWHSYPKVWNLGHPNIADLLTGPVVVQEKVDGSQFSFGLFNGVLRIRSKGQEMVVDAPEKMFSKAVDAVKPLIGLLHSGWAYRAEYLSKPKHNALAYSRVPKNNLILFDVNTGEETYAFPDELAYEAERLGFEAVPTIYVGMVDTIEKFREFLDRVSILGGQKIEGVVIKNYNRFGRDGKVLMGKFVSEAFKEVHAAEWKKENPGSKDILDMLVEKFRSPARWAKAVQHLREAGVLENSPRDIGALMKEAQRDLREECRDELIAELIKWATPHVVRGVLRGLPEWYKEELLKRQFEE